MMRRRRQPENKAIFDVMDNLAKIATGRDRSLFEDDVLTAHDALVDRVTGRRILVIGGAGSIGSSTVAGLIDFKPAALHVIDQNENELAELVRSIRSSQIAVQVDDFRTLPLDFGSPAMRVFLSAEGPYDAILNFAAIKHVRSEKDAYSVFQMLDTNIIKQARFLSWMAECGFSGRYFGVSTDKAANPTSMMGASKRVMEHVLFHSPGGGAGQVEITSARFANVAFSNGSLLQSFQKRLALRQPIAAPKSTRRYFVSLEESGQLCLLASMTAAERHILVPRLDPETALVELQTVAERFLRKHNLEPVIYDTEEDARSAVEDDAARGGWPLLLTELSTSGEKPYEEFVASNESVSDMGYINLLAVPYLAPQDENAVARMLAQLNEISRKLASEPRAPALDKDTFKTLLAGVEPGFMTMHRETGETLDNRI